MVDRAKEPGIKINQVFLESAAFEHRPDFLTLPADTVVELDTQLSIEFMIDPGDASRGAIRATAFTTDEGLYRFRISVGAIIEQDAANKNFTLDEYIATSSTALLVPFLREAVANITGRGRFGPIWIHPMNVVALMQESDSMTE